MTAPRKLPPASVLREFLKYQPASGFLFWKPRDRSWFNCDAHHQSWNRQNAARRAFTAKLRNGYLCGTLLGCQYRAHRIAWCIHYGEEPLDFIDHIDHDRANNCISNLRVVTKLEQNKNLSLRSDNTSGVVGVTYCNTKGRWRAQIGVDGKIFPLGTFKSVDEAIATRDAASKKFKFHPNHGIGRSDYSEIAP